MRFSHLALILLSLVTWPSVALAQDYVVITGVTDSIRITPGGTVVAQARAGDVFEVRGRDGAWLAILMFSGEYRYMQASLVRPADSMPTLPDEATRRRAFQGFVRAEDRATAEADRRIPPPYKSLEAIKPNIDLQRVLDDRYKLEVCHQFPGIQPAHYKSIIVEGIQKGWMP